MAVKKKTVKRARRKPGRSRSKKTLKKELIKAVSGLAFLLFLVVLAGFLTHHYLARDQPVQVAGKTITQRPLPVQKATVHKVPAYKKPTRVVPTFEVFPKKEIPHHKPPANVLLPLPEKLPSIAVIIDDLGYDKAIAEKFIKLDAVLTFSVLPYSPFQRKIAATAKARGFDVILHLPMEPKEYPRIDPGPGALLIGMSPDELIRQLNADLDCVPHIKGVNNHMGSRMTIESDHMNQIFTVLKQRGLFFIDSRTTAETRSIQSARIFKVPFAQRDVFLDHIQDPAYIRKQLQKLVRYAETHGEAIGIGHPHAVTYEVLREQLPELKRKVILVPASRVVRVAG